MITYEVEMTCKMKTRIDLDNPANHQRIAAFISENGFSCVGMDFDIYSLHLEKIKSFDAIKKMEEKSCTNQTK